MTVKIAVPVIDTHVILREGDMILLSQRGEPYGYGRWHAPSGKLDEGESVRAGAARELREETGVEVDPERLRLVHVVHHKQSADVERIGMFFEATELTRRDVSNTICGHVSSEGITSRNP